jgi:hypothetical protein
MMPTGYTAAIADGIDFETFVMRCARGMGALIMMRDEPMDTPIPERFESSDYHTRELAEANDEMAKLRAMSIEETGAAAREAFDAETKANSEAIARNSELRGKYEAMLKQVKSWNAPTPEHEGFKKFMADQLTESIRFDCSESYYEEHKPKQKAGAEWLADRIAKATRDVEYHTTEHAKEVERTESRNSWLDALRNSLSTHNAALTGAEGVRVEGTVMQQTGGG